VGQFLTFDRVVVPPLVLLGDWDLYLCAFSSGFGLSHTGFVTSGLAFSLYLEWLCACIASSTEVRSLIGGENAVSLQQRSVRIVIYIFNKRPNYLLVRAKHRPHIETQLH